ncbi:uncharacterized protein IL334_006626 [Kwoniella shivajii]|uniref:Velvet domain-containing protein n=1 Tax=Kwoniella shivajii TaxID=564305 RepID=A0ABZ1D6H3_9TREE|nr:hypothetical protein IL334_006626 [Kwoniella shivajii]
MGTILDDKGRKLLNALSKQTYTLSVKQQPERARLCSYKEENETIDRRPVDPPPVVELSSSELSIEQLFERTSFFIRATIVSASPIQRPFPDHGLPSVLEPYYQAVKTPTGADATTGEAVQTPEKLRLLDGKPGALCIFAKLSVRVPGVFRLMFTLYDTTESGIVELAKTVSEPFEVFSPKLFKGMHESTPLTRHLAAQGVKVKLRTDTSVGRQSTSRRRTPASNNKSTSSGNKITSVEQKPSASPSGSTMPYPSPSSSTQHSPLDRPRNTTHQASSSSRQAHPPSALTSNRALVWRQPMEFYGYSNTNEQTHHSHSQSAIPGPGPSTVRKRRFVDDGLIPSLKEITARYDFTPTPPATDLAAFSLSRSSPHPHDSNYRSHSRQTSPSATAVYRASPSSPFANQRQIRPSTNPSQSSTHRSSDGSSQPRLNHNSSESSFTSTNNSAFSSLSSRSTASSSTSSTVPSPLPRLNLGPGDDGIPRLPLPTLSSSSNRGVQLPATFVPPSVNQILDRFPSSGSSNPTTSYDRSNISPRLPANSNISPFGVSSDSEYGSSSPREGVGYFNLHANGGNRNAGSAGRNLPPPMTLPPIRPLGGDERSGDIGRS